MHAPRFGRALLRGLSPAFAVLAFTFLLLSPLHAQTAGDGTIQGTVTDPSGAVVSGATVTAVDVATNIATKRTSSSSGFYSIAPLQPGTYSVTVKANGFQTLVQGNVVVNALAIRTYNPVLHVGAQSQTVTVTSAPPVLDTADATLGMTMENKTYSTLPIQVNGQQRDPTAFATLTPGVQGGVRLPVIGGTGNFLGQLYLEGMPAETVSQQGDNRLVSQAVDLDAVDQFQVLTSSPPAEYMGAGAENFTLKSGGLKYHGQVSDFVRNTAFDTWSFTSKAATTKNALGQTIPAPKPSEHQNEASATVGGPVPFMHHKMFFFFAYDNYYERLGPAYQLFTIPSALMRQGDFTELNGSPGNGVSGTGANNPAIIYDPTTNSCAGSACTRKPYVGIKNGVATNNVMPASELSPIAQKMQSFLPAPTDSSVLVNNYLGGVPRGFNNHAIDWRVDYDISPKQRISSVGAMGAVNYLNDYQAPYIPGPYLGGVLANIFPKDYVVGDTYTLSANLVNQLKFSYTRFFQNIHNPTQNVKQWEAGTMGITNLPPGNSQSAVEFPEESFASTPRFGQVQSKWTSDSGSVATQTTTPNNYALTDNVNWVKGSHSMTFGLTYQWEEINNANPSSYTGVLQLPFNANSTADFAPGSNSLNSTSTGYSYASYLLGAVGGTPSIGLQPVSELGGRYHVISPYFEDNWKVTRNLTLDLGLRWDYLPPYREVKNRWTFLNPNLTNGITGTPGELQFAGNYGGPGVSCGCTTPVHTYWKNWGPRLGLAYSVNQKTVIRAGYAQVFTQAGGVGGRGGATNGTGQTGFNMTAIGPTEVTTGAGAGPSFYLNNSSYFAAAGLSNTSLFGPGFAYPTAPTPSAASQTLNTGFYVNPATGKMQSASTVSYADPYYSGRAPELEMYNFGVERGITNSMTLAVNYVGNESHFIVNSGTTGGNARGYWTNELNPIYLATLGPVLDSTRTKPLLLSPATPANVAILHSKFPNVQAPGFFVAAASVNSSATISQMLVHFPQYSGVNDTWGNVSNFSYNSLQITLDQRMSHGLSFNVNYTYAKNVGDDGTFRSGFNIPAAAISGGGHNWKMDRIDRSLTADNITNSLHAFGVYQLPFGKGQIGNDSRLVRWLAGGWQLSSIYTYASGVPIAVTSTGCMGQIGQCMPDLNAASPDFARHNARINGSWGKGPHGYQAANLGHVQYIDPGAFAEPTNVSTAPGCGPTSNCGSPQFLIGNAPRTAPLHLIGPNHWDMDAGLRRSFPIRENLQFQFEADCVDVFNHVNFSTPGSSNLRWSAGSTSFGTVTGASGNRDWQFAGHIVF